MSEYENEKVEMAKSFDTNTLLRAVLTKSDLPRELTNLIQDHLDKPSSKDSSPEKIETKTSNLSYYTEGEGKEAIRITSAAAKDSFTPLALGNKWKDFWKQQEIKLSLKPTLEISDRRLIISFPDSANKGILVPLALQMTDFMSKELKGLYICSGGPQDWPVIERVAIVSRVGTDWEVEIPGKIKGQKF